MSAYSVVDEHGNINNEKLSKELKDALEFDIRYKQTDNMKKRAVKVAGDYKEFKEMVAAAHLKKLTKEEVEALSHVKRGWQKRSIKNHSDSAFLLNQEFEDEKLLKQNQEDLIKKSTIKTKKKPKTTMEIERDLRRCSTDEEKLIYLLSIGLKRIKLILTSTADADLIEEIIRLLIIKNNQLMQLKTIITSEVNTITVTNEMTEEVEGDKEEEENEPKAKDFDQVLIIKWLLNLIEFQRFEMYLTFASNEQLDQILNIFHTALNEEILSTTLIKKVELTIMKCCKK